MIFLFLFGFLSWGSQPQPIYSVWEIEVLEAFGTAGQKYRIAMIESRYPIPTGEEIYLGRRNLHSKSLGSDGRWAEPSREFKVGETKIRTEDPQTFTSLFGGPPLEIAPLKGQSKVRYSIRLVKSCKVGNIETRSERFVESRTSGIIAIPTIVKREVTRIPRPSCYDESDATQSLGAASSAKTEATKAAIAATEAQNAFEERNRKRMQLAERYASEIKRQAFEIEKTMAKPAAVSSAFLGEVRSDICPALPALLKALNLKSVEMLREETEGKTADGYHTTTSKMKAKLVADDGCERDVSHVFYDSGVLVIAKGKLDAENCLMAEVDEGRARSGQSPSPADVTKKTLRRLLEREVEDSAAARAKLELP